MTKNCPYHEHKAYYKPTNSNNDIVYFCALKIDICDKKAENNKRYATAY